MHLSFIKIKKSEIRILFNLIFLVTFSCQLFHDISSWRHKRFFDFKVHFVNVVALKIQILNNLSKYGNFAGVAGRDNIIFDKKNKKYYN